MKLNKALLVTSAITMSLFTGVANADVIDGKETGTIHFKGQFVESTCTIETNNENSSEGTVQLGTWLVSHFQKSDETTKPTKFVIALNECPDVIKKQRSLSLELRIVQIAAYIKHPQKLVLVLVLLMLKAIQLILPLEHQRVKLNLKELIIAVRRNTMPVM